MLGLFSKRVTTPGVLAGLATGISIAAILMLTGRDPYRGLNPGFIALCASFGVTGIVSLLTTVPVVALQEASIDGSQAGKDTGIASA